MSLYAYFITAFLLSALGSVPVGIITLTIMKRTIEASKQAGLMIALGATIPEFIYTYVALYSFDFLNDNIEINQNIQIATIIVFFSLAIYYLLKKVVAPKMINPKDNYFDFFRGVLVAFMNLLVLPFWVFIALWLKSYEFYFSTQSQMLTFSLGSALGALVIFLAYVQLGVFIIKKKNTIILYTNKIVGVIFLSLSFYQLIQFF
ncbi:MAG: threonine/homoserine/homoserine lactone efflux protein [Saprospiraceae bacterium]|jgi:threonine/homoserine/homoserine lactone efflux protein